MIEYIEKGIGLHKAIVKVGHSLVNRDGVWIASDDEAVQAIIDSYDPAETLRIELIDKINFEAGEARVRYTTNIPFQEASYQAKEIEVRRYKAEGYPEDLTGFPFVYAESDATGATPQEAADTIIAQADQWMNLLAEVERLRRKGIVKLKSESDWKKLKVVADEYINALKAI